MDKLEGRIAYLPDGQKVRIEYVADGLATVKRLDGQWRGEIAVCAVTSLRMPDWLNNRTKLDSKREDAAVAQS